MVMGDYHFGALTDSGSLLTWGVSWINPRLLYLLIAVFSNTRLVH